MAEAKLNREYAARMLIVGAVMIGICVWSLYDGMVGWPKVNAEMDKARPSLLATNMTVTTWLTREDDGRCALDRLFTEAGVKAPGKLAKKISELKLPDTHANDTDSLDKQAQQLTALLNQPIYTEHDLNTQWVQAGLTAFLALLTFLAVGLKSIRRFIADDHGLSGNGFGPQTLTYESITAINWSRWKQKGIIVLTFKSRKTVKLDGWHFAGMTDIADELRKHRPDLAPDGNIQ